MEDIQVGLWSGTALQAEDKAYEKVWRQRNRAPLKSYMVWLELNARFGINGRSMEKYSRIMVGVEYFHLTPNAVRLITRFLAGNLYF